MSGNGSLPLGAENKEIAVLDIKTPSVFEREPRAWFVPLTTEINEFSASPVAGLWVPKSIHSDERLIRISSRATLFP
jgi:hypothetical protein